MADDPRQDSDNRSSSGSEQDVSWAPFYVGQHQDDDDFNGDAPVGRGMGGSGRGNSTFAVGGQGATNQAPGSGFNGLHPSLPRLTMPNAHAGAGVPAYTGPRAAVQNGMIYPAIINSL